MIVAYDGRAFHGFQRQRGLRTVQGTLTEAVRALDPNASEVRGASRTDAGVHARGQVVSFDAIRALPPKGWRMQLNKKLGEDLSVRGVELCAAGFDPRFDSLGKRYRYRFHVGESRCPIRSGFSWHVGPQLAKSPKGDGEDVHSYFDIEAMRETARGLLGTHDYRAFRAADDERLNTVRTLRSIEILPSFGGEEDSLAIEVEGNAFMKNMVRILAGTLLDVGRGKRTPQSVIALLGEHGRREDAGLTAPAHGLCLISIEGGRLAICGERESK